MNVKPFAVALALCLAAATPAAIAKKDSATLPQCKHHGSDKKAVKACESAAKKAGVNPLRSQLLVQKLAAKEVERKDKKEAKRLKELCKKSRLKGDTKKC